MTEDEAKTKACFRAATFGGSQQLSYGPGPHCIASACMAWRWKVGFEPYTLEHLAAAGHTPSAAEGFCGLAGEFR